jgi:hypothetical protein
LGALLYLSAVRPSCHPVPPSSVLIPTTVASNPHVHHRFLESDRSPNHELLDSSLSELLGGLYGHSAVLYGPLLFSSDVLAVTNDTRTDAFGIVRKPLHIYIGTLLNRNYPWKLEWAPCKLVFAVLPSPATCHRLLF